VKSAFSNRSRKDITSPSGGQSVSQRRADEALSMPSMAPCCMGQASEAEAWPKDAALGCWRPWTRAPQRVLKAIYD